MHLRADSESVSAGLQSQAALWAVSISGDAPIFTLHVDADLDTEVVKQALKAQTYLHSRAVFADLVVFNERSDAGAQDLQHAIERLCDVARNANHADGMPQNIFVLRKDLIEPAIYQAIVAASRAVFDVRDGGLIEQIKRAPSRFASAPLTGHWGDTTLIPRMPKPAAVPDAADEGNGLSFWNGYGGFAQGGREYVVRLSGGQSTPQPWINVVANEHFGFHIAAEGAAFTWSRNSRDYQLTAWTNDMVINRPGEAFYVADLEDGAVMTPYAGLSHRPTARFEARHGLGYSVFTTVQDEIALEAVHTVHLEKPVKLTRMRVHNTGVRTRTLRLYGYAEWILGASPNKTKPFVMSTYHGDVGAVFATNPFGIAYAGRVALFAASETPLGVSASRREFVGRYGTVQQPKAVFSGSLLSGSMEPDGDPAVALSFDITLAAGEQKDICFYMADAGSSDEARSLLSAVRDVEFDEVLTATRNYWNEFTGRLQIETPDAALNHMVNSWLPYQTLGCNIMARTAFYQASGAVNFRQQLQDTLAFLVHSPELARRQILDAGQRQFREGDVQHWWLTETGAGVRTHISDDVVWLAYAIDQYCSATGDRRILDEELHFIEGAALTPGMHDAFYKPEVSQEKASLYEHAALALDLAVKRTGSNGLPLILSGDWTEGMNRIGIEGRGESVWLGWLLAYTLRRFISHAETREDAGRVRRWSDHLNELTKAVETAGWDGEFYRRGYFDDGAALGSKDSLACQIDSTAQSWNILSGEGDPGRGHKSMDAVLERLVDDEGKFIRVFTPPFSNSARDPGLIKAYPPGVRENGGQYSQAAIWSIFALAKMGRGDDAWRLFEMLNPINRALSRESADAYRVEPFVMAADVYSEGDLKGRGGWTWYTGSAAWLYRTATEGILGIYVAEGHLYVKPALPSGWDGYAANLRLAGEVYRIVVSKAAEATGIIVSINDIVLRCAADGYPLVKKSE
jgi:cyclic beta-1,2-glucan synthetase